MISTNIDGSVPGSNTLADLLALIADPKAYASKLAELEKATAENKKYVVLIGPASEIDKLRSEAALDRENAAAATAFAKNFAANIVDEAKADAASTIAKARDKAADIVADTKVANAEAKKLKASLTEAIENANALMANAEAKALEADNKTFAANAKAEELAKAQADLAAEKDAIAARHKQFIESL